MINELKKLMNEGGVVFFGGAGVSTESGLPDFRSVDGLYSQKYKFPPETILSHQFFFNHTSDFFEFYREKLVMPHVLPNDAHKALAQLEQEGKLTAVVTQNIDNLHQEAGSKNVFELHGSIHRNYCIQCGKFFGIEKIRQENIPTCECGGIVKPDVVLFDESLNDKVIEGAVNAIAKAKTLIVGGTSLGVYPAAGLLRFFKKGKIVLINKTETPLDCSADLVFHESIGNVFRKVCTIC
ncbi:MAG: NAD-dependent protein deacylase [Clostridiales bacterium]|nr:NAD-dependent protein deacylase [Clostridiales bacterium]